MATYFLDSSAIIKRYVAEKGQVWVATLCNPAQGHELYIAQVTLVRASTYLCLCR
jgi:predicted nucleic acid-binding protein